MGDTLTKALVVSKSKKENPYNEFKLMPYLNADKRQFNFKQIKQLFR